MKTIRIILVVLMATIAGINAQALTTQKNSTKKAETLTVYGNCESCKARIEKAAKSVEGVSSAYWSAEKQSLQVKIDTTKTSVDAIAKAVAAVGHDTEKYKAPDDVYKKLPQCCLYRK